MAEAETQAQAQSQVEAEQQASEAADLRREAQITAGLDVVRGSLSYELSDEDAQAVRGNIERHLKLADKLRAYPLVNADEPDFAFRVYRAEG